MKKIYFGTNLKMYKNNQEVKNYLIKISNNLSKINTKHKIEFFIIPSYTSLESAMNIIHYQKSSPPIIIGAQNMNANEKGQFTGEISPLMLQELGVQLVMIGHSERRHLMGETDQEENQKVLSSLKHNFITLLCIGETLEQKNYHISDEILRMQLKIGLNGVSIEQLPNLRIAYEPVWAIGTSGIPASAEYANNKHQIIKECLIEIFGKPGNDIPILYGGSVNQENASNLIIQPYIDGLFVGRSAWDADQFHSLIQESITAYENNENGYSETALLLIKYLGGKDNIGALTHCATRIRVILKNETKIDKIGIEKINIVKGIFSVANQFQIIFGKHIVDEVYLTLKNLLN
ncbi:triose-phosphate isomerase [Avibacterium sp. 21-599]|uniref:triose-phosphate isomerase n=1 Tax=Avibacterium sp. 21-599 TaxID=2911528 RepID=UPI0022485C9E|nr:triose-phosphate isomerase [Avibacterium sp. 21-599]MCW9717179.1 triose-phosphate isomerase [Avibacterium sp. 21-599]